MKKNQTCGVCSTKGAKDCTSCNGSGYSGAGPCAWCNGFGSLCKKCKAPK